MRRTVLTRAGLVCAAAAAVVLGFAAPAAAHVTVNPDTAAQGAYTKIAFRVPNEQDTGDTVKLELDLPTDHPIASVSVRPVPGWTAVTQTTKLSKPISDDDGTITEAVTRITFTAAAGQGIHPGQFQEFELSLGPLPSVKQLEFKALQTYSDGTVVRWIDDPNPDGSEADHPAPILTLSSSPAVVPSAVVSSAATTKSSSGTAVGLAIAGLVLGLAGLIVALLAYRKVSTARSTS